MTDVKAPPRGLQCQITVPADLIDIAVREYLDRQGEPTPPEGARFRLTSEGGQWTWVAEPT